ALDEPLERHGIEGLGDETTDQRRSLTRDEPRAEVEQRRPALAARGAVTVVHAWLPGGNARGRRAAWCIGRAIGRTPAGRARPDACRAPRARRRRARPGTALPGVLWGAGAREAVVGAAGAGEK